MSFKNSLQSTQLNLLSILGQLIEKNTVLYLRQSTMLLFQLDCKLFLPFFSIFAAIECDRQLESDFPKSKPMVFLEKRFTGDYIDPQSLEIKYEEFTESWNSSSSNILFLIVKIQNKIK